MEKKKFPPISPFIPFFIHLSPYPLSSPIPPLAIHTLRYGLGKVKQTFFPDSLPRSALHCAHLRYDGSTKSSDHSSRHSHL
jgi:hypothetical protein